jgi:hypothetical protein
MLLFFLSAPFFHIIPHSIFIILTAILVATMGNQQSGGGSSATTTAAASTLENNFDRATRSFTRHVNGALGLSRPELDKRCQPSG